MSEKVFSKSKYEEICGNICKNFTPSGNKEKDEEIILFEILREIHRFLNIEFNIFPAEGASKIRTYQWNLLNIVKDEKSEPFDSQQTSYKYISGVLKIYD